LASLGVGAVGIWIPAVLLVLGVGHADRAIDAGSMLGGVREGDSGLEEGGRGGRMTLSAGAEQNRACCVDY
jgi:hypothetical protein